MGAWGPGIFSDDDACDIREDVRDLVADGVPPTEIEQRVLADYAGPLSDPYHQAVARLALALTLHRYGRLEAAIRDRALAVINDGWAIGEWGNDPKRRAALQKAHAQLLSPQPTPKKVRKPTVRIWPWSAGEMFSYRHSSGTSFIFVVRSVSSDKGGSYPTIIPLWAGMDPPPCETLMEVPPLSVRQKWVARFNKKITPDDPYWPQFSEICLLATPNRTPTAFAPLPCRRQMPQRMVSGRVVLFRDFDRQLEEMFHLS